MQRSYTTPLHQNILIALAGLTLVTSGCHTEGPSHRSTEPNVSDYGTMEGQIVQQFTLTNVSGMQAHIIEYGAILTSLTVPDRDGKPLDVTLGYDSLEDWRTNTSYLGATVGRYGNRIADGMFVLDGETYRLATNNDPGGIPCHLHGGIKGFDKVIWTGKPVTRDNATGVELTYTSSDGEEGYPGTLTTTVTYWLTDNNELIWEATATTDKATPINIVHHSYWNLTGDPSISINDHTLKLEADHYLPTNAGLIPTGERKAVSGTPMDFTTATAIGARVEDDYESLTLGSGYDHCWVLRPEEGMRLAATLHDPVTGRTLEILTDQPGIQFYGGNFLDGTITGKNGVVYQHRTGLCLETQVFPDSPNQPEFPSSILRPGETYSHRMIHRFSAK